MYKKSIDKNNLEANANLDENEGVACNKLVENVPNYNSAPCEKVIQGDNNTRIVLGRDRPSTKNSGYGGLGDTHCGAIDIVVGGMGVFNKKLNQWADPNFKTDAARIHISQKTNIDENFGINSSKLASPKGRSAIGIKADDIRLISRNGIKLVTGTDITNSVGGQIKTITGISLIAGNQEQDIQPIPKGENLRQLLDRTLIILDNTLGILNTFLMSQMEYNTILATHIHPTIVGPTSPSVETAAIGTKTIVNQLVQTQASLINCKVQIAGARTNYLQKVGVKYINSRWNNTN